MMVGECVRVEGDWEVGRNDACALALATLYNVLNEHQVFKFQVVIFASWLHVTITTSCCEYQLYIISHHLHKNSPGVKDHYWNNNGFMYGHILVSG